MEIREIQKSQLRILNELRRVCENNSINYYIAQGTLIGAVRHGGFIPWDDDADVILYWRDIEKLMEVFPKQAAPKYLITNHHIEKHYPLAWTKIRNTKTVSMPKRYEKMPVNWGICIDLFPVYYISDVKLFRKIEILCYKISRKLIFSEFSKYDEKPDFLAKMLGKIPVSVRGFLADVGLKPIKSHKKPTKDIFVACRGGFITQAETVFGEKTYLEFEGNMYPVPSNYDKYLTAMYGDYMTPPPEDERGGHDLTLGEIVWKGEDE